ncbi:MAG: divergent polysaccharide deacetylase family protein [Pseudomonadales bacterium]
MIFRACLAVCLTLLPFTHSHAEHASVPVAKLALVIDDMGHNVALNRAVLQLSGDISFAFLPHARYSKRMAIAAKALERDILLHAPMENFAQLSLGPGGLTTRQSQGEFKAVLARNIEAIPYIRGVNNHTGSKLTSQSLQMQWTMQVLAERELFFLDSRTSAKSVAAAEARKAGIPVLVRDVFLDHSASPKDMAREFERAITIATKHGKAVLIAHPRKATVAFLQRHLAQVEARGVRLVSLSTLLQAVKAPVVVAASDKKVEALP